MFSGVCFVCFVFGVGKSTAMSQFDAAFDVLKTVPGTKNVSDTCQFHCTFKYASNHDVAGMIVTRIDTDDCVCLVQPLDAWLSFGRSKTDPGVYMEKRVGRKTFTYPPVLNKALNSTFYTLIPVELTPGSKCSIVIQMYSTADGFRITLRDVSTIQLTIEVISSPSSPSITITDVQTGTFVELPVPVSTFMNNVAQMITMSVLDTNTLQIEVDGGVLGVFSVTGPLSNLRYIKIDKTDAEVHAIYFVAGN